MLRIGGSAADDLAFVPQGHSSADFPRQSIHVDEAYWDDMVALLQQTHCKLVWDLNALSMRLPDGSWNFTNAEALLRRVARTGQRLYGVQLGNEPGHWWSRHYPNGTWADRLGQDVVMLRGLLRDIFPDAALRPKIMGPDVCMGGMNNTSPCANITFFQDFVKASGDSVDAITVHHYGLHNPADCTLARFLDPTVSFDYQLDHLKLWRDAKRALAPSAQLILGETATAGGGGCPGLSNTFIAGFFNVHRLSQVQALGYDGVFRQDLVGWSGIGTKSSYALAGDGGWVGGADAQPLTPNPDFFSSVLYKELVGDIVLDAQYQQGWPATLSVHAACAKTRCGELVISFANLAAASVELRDDVLIHGSPRTEFFLTERDGNLTSRSVWLNDEQQPLRLRDELPGRRVSESGTPLVLPAFSYGFVVLEGGGTASQHVCECSLGAAGRGEAPPLVVV